jgi:hypothetical protein
MGYLLANMSALPEGVLCPPAEGEVVALPLRPGAVLQPLWYGLHSTSPRCGYLLRPLPDGGPTHRPGDALVAPFPTGRR